MAEDGIKFDSQHYAADTKKSTARGREPCSLKDHDE